jgi:hypothetical protein
MIKIKKPLLISRGFLLRISYNYCLRVFCLRAL